jgi:hypothetical protein
MVFSNIQWNVPIEPGIPIGAQCQSALAHLSVGPSPPISFPTYQLARLSALGMAQEPAVGFEPTTSALRMRCSAN